MATRENNSVRHTSIPYPETKALKLENSTNKCETNRSMRESEGKMKKACAAPLFPSNRKISFLDRVQTRNRKLTTTVRRPNAPTSPGVCDGCQRVPPTDGNVFGSSTGGPLQTTVVEGLVIPGRLDTVQATNFVLTQQVY